MKTVLTIALSLCILAGNSQDVKRSNSSIDITKSTIEWTGKKLTGEHYGNILLKEGNLVTSGGAIKGGAFAMDMSSITCTDITDEKSNKRLVDHLKSEDFFAVEKFPTAKFEITKAERKDNTNYLITGNLTIKNITNTISFPASVETKDGRLVANANIIFDRSKFDVKFGSQSFFENLGDKMVYDDIELKVILVSTSISSN
jgi:polyisoprenoid-binding protein YceI